MSEDTGLYRGSTFQLRADAVVEPAAEGRPERCARIAGDTLWMTSPDERRRLRRDELPADGPLLDSGLPVLDWCWLIARRDIESNFYDDGMYAGRDFRRSSTWVRDTSYSVLMGLDLLYPEKVRQTLGRLLDRSSGEIKLEQYADLHENRCYTMTDNIIWVLAAESYGRTTGDAEMLRGGAAMAVNTIRRSLRERFDPASGLFVGGSSFFDGSSGYPAGLTGPQLRSASTNFLYVRASRLLAELDGMPSAARGALEQLEGSVRAAMDRELWLDEAGHYAQFHHGLSYREHRYEAVAHALAVADPAIPADRAMRMVRATPRPAFGVPAIHPAYLARPVYHSKAVWPFTLGLMLWALRCRGGMGDQALAASDDTAALRDYLAAELVRTGMLEGTFMELIDTATGRGVYSPSQLWSAAAVLALVQQTIFGMTFHADRIEFRPSVPSWLGGRTVTLRDMPIRGRRMTLAVDGRGRVSVDGQPLDGNVLRLDQPAAGPGAAAVLANVACVEMPEAATATRVAADVQRGDAVELRLSPSAQTVFPAEDQIGSYDFTAEVRNLRDQPATVALDCRWTGTEGRIDRGRLRLSVAAGQTATATVRLVFDAPPVRLDRGQLTVATEDGSLRATATVRRLLTLDGHWQMRPMFRNASLRYSGDLSGYDDWTPPLRAPMPAELRIGPYVGVLWYVRRIVVPDDWAGRELVLYAGAMGERDETHFNGMCIGGMGDEKTSADGRPRRYDIPADIVKPGAANSVSIKTFSTTGRSIGITQGPFFVSPADDFAWALAEAEAMMLRNRLPEASP